MSNEQKAIEIAGKNMESYRVVFDDGCLYDVVSNSECYDSAIEMAKWKDDEFMKLINSKAEYARNKIEEFHDKQKRLKYEGMLKITLELAKEILNKFHNND